MNRVCARAREMLKPFGKKTNTAKRVLRVLAVPLAACALLFGATSASADQTVPFSNHIVKTVNPTGTTVNLFDYWVVNGDNDKSVNINNNNGNDNTGINKGHQLKFNGGAGSGINKWTGRSGIGGFGRLQFVKNTLVDGYPSIKAGTYTSYNTSGTYTDESLAYLFNNDSQVNGKAVYNKVQGLFQLKDGYYVYDSYGSDGSDGNYAVYNSTTNSFDVYDKAGVYKDSVSDANRGQFFPFDSADKVFEERNGQLSPIGITDGTNDKLNHHFGMSMTTEFVQPKEGKTTDLKDMVFKFSGDDDVWVYIDGVLVGDLGGIHEKATLEINFANGEVKVGHVDGANGTKKEIEKTNIKAKFEDAGADTTNFFGNTFRDSTKHTLSFFYLERGAGASNMSLKFNLTTLPSSEVAKVDQNGEAVNGATFKLYRSDGPDADWNKGELVAQGTTKDRGQLILQKSNGSVLSFDEEHNTNHCDYFVLKETDLPEGYRSSLTSSTTATPGELHLQYKQAAASGSGGVVVAPQTTVTTADGKSWTGSRMWLNGGYLAAKETISLDKDTQDNKGNAISSGTTFAVVLKLTGASEDHTSEDAWTAVTGNPLNGYKLCSAHGIAGAVEAAKSADTSVFDVDTKGDYVVTVRSLPGDIEKYAAMMTDKSKAEYTVAVYHTTASSLAGATIDNTSMVQYQTINRQFSTVIHLANVQNRLFVQKVDDLGKPVNDATFQLYQAKDVTGNSPSTYAIKPGAEPYDTVKANDATYPYEIKGTACFPLDSVNHKPLTKGTYYLRESVSPDGYEINNTITKVIVDDSGVYVDAGEKGDGVLSVSGPGSLIASLAQFGSPDSIDNTLTHIKGKLQSAAVDANGNLTWGPTSPADNWMHMRYDKTTQGTKTVLCYVENGGERDGKLATIFADTGINRMALYQDDDATNGTDLGTLQLNHLFTTATAVQYTDAAKVSVPVEKKWVGPAAAKATVRLLADGKDTGKSIELNESNNWKGSFKDLAKYSKSGSEVAYAVAEDAVEGYSSKVTGDAGRGFTVTNTVKTGELDVSKTVVAREGLAVDADKIFKFVVEATDAMGRKVSGTYGDATFEDGEATLKLKDGQTARITGLPAGTAYTVTERAADGYKAAVNGAEGSRADGSISADQVAAAAFTNTFDPAPATASVPELTKVLAGGRKPGLQEGEFTFVLSLTDGAGNVLEGYPIEAKNNKDGKVSFGELSFTNLGTYHATVTEKANGDVLIEDDAHAYTFDITVTQTGAGLKAEISNERGKKTFTNTFTPHDNTKTVTKADASGAKVDVDGKLVGVGDTLTYTIGWANNSVDDRGAARAADVTVTDVLPKGVDYVEGSADGAAYDAATRTLTWSLGEQAAGATGTLSFDVKVSAEAAVVDDISNTATVKVGENESHTTTTHNKVSCEGSLTVKKTVVGGDSQREFGFTVALTDGDGEPVSGTFGKGEHAVTFTDGKMTFTLKDGGEKTIAGLPVGARCTVTEDAAEGYTTTVNGADGSKAEDAVTEDGATVAFTNTYGTATEGRDVSTAGLFTKALKGRDWAEGDSFQFALTGEGGAPMPEGSADGSKTVSVTAAAGTKTGDRVAFDFGAIRYTLDDIKDAGFAELGGKRVRAKTFTYTVREVRPDDGSAIAGVSYDGHTATMTVTVTDDGSGNLTATTPAIAQASGGDFVNTYTTELDYSVRAGVRLSKTLSGHAMEAGQFAFTVTADAETAAKLGLKTDKDAYAVAAADDGKADLVDLIGGTAGGDVKFTDADAGKTYSFTVAETKLGCDGYTNDTAPRTVTIAPAYDAATGKLTVTTTVARDGVEVARSEVSTADDAAATPAPVTVAFQNSYEATGVLGGEGNVAINATKTLTGRAAAAGEFSFSVRDARGDVVATATNRASGDGEAAGLAFSPIAYTTDALEQMVADGTATRAADGSWAIPYTVSEDGTDRLPAGVTATASSFGITVKATDNGKGGLDVAVDYPGGSDGTLSFVNGYGTNEATVDIAGTKTLALSQAGLGLAQADIAGKYTFKIEPLDGAPALVDASGKTVTEATNDAAEIDGDGLRTKTFAYRVSESGSVDGVVNDATAARTFAVRVVEDTNAGTLAAEVLPAEGTPEGKGAFEFTNTYGVNPTPSSVTDQITVSKKLEGRDLAEGEFEFRLVEIAADGSESVAATGGNAADGTVALSPVAYTAPGTHGYELREVAGTAGGVTYDRATYRVRTTVADAGNGKLTVRHELADAEGNPTGGDSVTFTNGYEAAPVTLKLGTAKVLKGAELKAGQFSFELKSRDGKVMSTAKNAADGSVTFDALTFKQAGTYTFTVSEVDDGQAHVTYDKAVRKIVVTVSDEAADGTKTGYLSARVSYEGDANVPPVFTNSYVENPGTPGTPENPGTPGGGSDGGSDNGSGSGSGGDGSKGGMPDTGDRSLPVEALAAMAGIGALTAAGGAVLYRRRR